MFFVVLIVGILFITSFFPIKTNRAKKRLLWTVFTLGAIMLSLRGLYVGMDTLSYSYIAKDIFKLNTWSYSSYGGKEIEPLFFYLIKLLGCIIESPHFIFFVFGIFTMAAFGVFIYRYSTDVVLSSLIFFSSMYFFTFNGMRQYFGLAFLLFAIMSAMKDKRVWSICLVVMGGFVHYSMFLSIPFLVMLFLFKNNSLKKSLLLTAGTFVALGFVTVLIENVILFIPHYARFFEYENSTDLAENKASTTDIILCLLTFVLVAYFFIKQNKLSKYCTTHFNSIACADISFMNAMAVLVCAYYVSFIVATQMWILERVKVVFIYSYMIAMPYLITVPFYKSRFRFAYQIFRFLLILFYVILTVRYVVVNGHGVFPYAFFWQSPLLNY